jgi:hypothetical protein
VLQVRFRSADEMSGRSADRLVALVAGGYCLSWQLRGSGSTQDCVISGRKDCASITQP